MIKHYNSFKSIYPPDPSCANRSRYIYQTHELMSHLECYIISYALQEVVGSSCNDQCYPLLVGPRCPLRVEGLGVRALNMHSSLFPSGSHPLDNLNERQRFVRSACVISRLMDLQRWRISSGDRDLARLRSSSESNSVIVSSLLKKSMGRCIIVDRCPEYREGFRKLWILRLRNTTLRTTNMQ